MTCWVPVPGHDGYEVSDDGDVRSLDREVFVQRKHCSFMRRRQGMLLVHRLTRAGYHRVTVDALDMYVHRLVLEAFVGPAPADKPHAAHWDGDKANNRLTNLRWATVAENQADKVRHGRMIVGRGERHRSATLTQDQVLQIRRIGHGARKKDIAQMFGVSPGAVGGVINGKTWRHLS